MEASSASCESSASVRVALVTHDWGVLIGLRWACDHPGSVARARDLERRLLRGPRVARHGESDAHARVASSSIAVFTRESFGDALQSVSSGMTDDALDEYWKALRGRGAAARGTSSCTARATSRS